jgi:hypothetical protein
MSPEDAPKATFGVAAGKNAERWWETQLERGWQKTSSGQTLEAGILAGKEVLGSPSEPRPASLSTPNLLHSSPLDASHLGLAICLPPSTIFGVCHLGPSIPLFKVAESQNLVV